MTHTPGPWRYRKTLCSDIEIWRHEPNENPITLIAKVIRQQHPLHDGDHVCNGQLIAAAPELLNMVQEFIFTLQDEHGSYYVDGNIIKGKALWEKASGEVWKDEELEEDEVEDEVEGEQS